MIRLNSYQLYVLGATLEPLRDFEEGMEPQHYLNRCLRARGELKNFLDSKELPLVTSRPTAEKLLGALDVVIEKVFDTMATRIEKAKKGEEPPAFAKLSTAEASMITGTVRDFEPILAAELQEKPTYHVSKKGIFYTPDLIERADAIFDDSLYIAEEARADICQAGRCLAFELWTATGFHVFRATETMILRYYEALTDGKHPLKDSQRNWGAYIDALRNNKADEKLVDYLDYFKKNHRNPVIHPEVKLDKDEAIAVFLAMPQAIVPLSKARKALMAPIIEAAGKMIAAAVKAKDSEPNE